LSDAPPVWYNKGTENFITQEENMNNIGKRMDEFNAAGRIFGNLNGNAGSIWQHIPGQAIPTSEYKKRPVLP
jgi:hypothetical protein